MASFMGDRESLTPSGLKRKRGRELADHSGTGTETNSQESDDNDGVKKTKTSPSSSGTYKPGDMWSQEDSGTLISKLLTAMPADDVMRYNTQAERVNWEDIQFGKFSASDCKDRWHFFISKLRKFRTMTELINDAKEWTHGSWKTFNKKLGKHPDMPKKPLTPFFSYFVEKRQKYSKANPDLSTTDISKLLATKFRNLTAKKKQKYVDAYANQTEAFKLSLVKFKEEHPELYNGEDKDDKSSRKRSGSVAPKGTSAMQIYIKGKILEHKKKNPELQESHKQCWDLYRQKWSELTDTKKVKYINKALEAKVQYDEEVTEYSKSHPDFKPKAAFLSKLEQKIKDRMDGKPDKPPVNGYGLYTSKLLHTLTELPSHERMAEISRKWKLLSQEEKDAHNKMAEQAVAKFKEDLEKYLIGLSPDEREKVELEFKTFRKTKAPNPTAKAAAMANIERPQQPVSALFMFKAEKTEKYKKKHPELDSQKLTKLMAKDYYALAESKKAKYKKMAEEEKQKLTQSQEQQAEVISREAKKAKNMHFPGEPKKPPVSGYQLFSTEQLLKLKGVPSNDRMSVLSQKWKQMTEQEKLEYKTRRDNMANQFVKDLQKFKNKLSAKDLKRYEDLEATRKMKKQPVRSKPAPPVEIKEESESELESESDSKSDSSAEEESSGSESESESEEEEAETPVQNGAKVDAKAENSEEVYSSSSGSEESGSEEEDDEEEEGEEQDGVPQGGATNAEDNNSASSASESGSESESASASESESESEEEE